MSLKVGQSKFLLMEIVVNYLLCWGAWAWKHREKNTTMMPRPYWMSASLSRIGPTWHEALCIRCVKGARPRGAGRGQHWSILRARGLLGRVYSLYFV